MYAGRVACCSLVSHVEYRTRAPLRLEKSAARSIKVRKKDKTDGRTTDSYITLNARQRNNANTSQQRADFCIDVDQL